MLGAVTLRDNPDFTGFVPGAGNSSTSGSLSLNHELTSNAGVTVFTAGYNASSKLWQLSNPQEVSFSGVAGTSRNCSGAITPWGTVISGEENTNSTDSNGDGYHDIGWLCEIDPTTRTVVNKVWKVGKSAHENACISADMTVLYTGADQDPNGFLYKYVLSTPGNLSNGILYVLQRNPYPNDNTGVWKTLPNTTPTNCNDKVGNAVSAGAYNFRGIEDVEIGPDGKVYFAAKIEGRVWRFTDNGTTVSDLETWVGPAGTFYNIATASGTQSTDWGLGNDNLAFDCEGNLWVLQDGSKNYIWMIPPDHSASTPNVKLFGISPSGSEPTGITFSPNCRYMFMSFQHPSGGNTAAVVDAAGQSVVMNRGTTFVLARKEFLGTGSFPIEWLSFNLEAQNQELLLTWKAIATANAESFEVEQSDDGLHFEKMGTLPVINPLVEQTYQFSTAIPTAERAYFRIKAVQKDGIFGYSAVKSAFFKKDIASLTIAPNPIEKGSSLQFSVNNLRAERPFSLQIYNALGLLMAEKSAILEGNDAIDTSNWPAGLYFLQYTDGQLRQSTTFMIR